MNTYTKAALILFAFTFISCDKDFNTIGSDIIGDEHFSFEKYNALNINSFIKETGPVQTNNLAINQLGIYNDPVFGTTKASFVSQIEMTTINPTIGYDYEIDSVKDSVYIYIPFFSTVKTIDANGDRTFVIDSIYGNSSSKFDLKVYRNGYFLREYDPTTNNQSYQKFYSDAKADIAPFKGAEILNDDQDDSQNSQFYFNKNEIKIYKTNGSGQYYNSSNEITTDPSEYVVKERKIPGVWLNLNKNFFKTQILDAVANGSLIDNNVFKEYFRGLYFEVNETVPGQGSLAKLNFSAAELVVQYHSYDVDNDPDVNNFTKRSITFQMGYVSNGLKRSNSINLFEFSNIKATYSDALSASGSSSEKLFIKGGSNGSVAFIDLFNDVELQQLRNNNWLINEANLVFYVDQASMSSATYEPERIFLYDATNGMPLLDYYTDPSTSTNLKNNKYLFGGILEKETSGKGIKYKIRITDYINNVLNGTSSTVNENLRLGLAITDNINIITTVSLKNQITINSDIINTVPVSSLLNVGTVLYGAQSTDSDKKLKLEIYYTEPK